MAVVIPARNEATVLPRLLADLSRQGAREVVVVDGGSEDGTRAVAESRGARVVTAPPCRGQQLDEGARATSGAILWFLHADVRVPDGALATIVAMAADRGLVAGAFGVRFATAATSGRHRAALRVIAASANLRARWLRAPYGDAGLFMRREVYRDLGGFAPLGRCEDLDLILRIRRRGLAGGIRMAPIVLEVSGRRWDREGAWRTTLRNAREAATFVMASRRAGHG